MIRKLLILLVFFLPIKNYAQQQSLKYQISYKQNKFELSDKNKQTISTISDTLQGRTNYIIYINGYTDSDADSSYNHQLSLKRSLEVKSFLVLRGIDETLIKVQALGEEQPLVENSSPLGKAKNRRVEVLVFFLQLPQEKVLEIKNKKNEASCNGDTTVMLEGGYVLTMSKCDWETNHQCLRIEKKLTYKFKIKENWLKKHIGFKNYQKYITYEPHYEFKVVACRDSCFKNKMKLLIPHYNAQGLKVSEKYSQKKNDKNQSTTLSFRKTKLGDSAYYVADIYCPGTLNCGFENRCSHSVKLYAKNNISILSYTYNESLYSDSLAEVKPLNNKKVTDSYQHTFFRSLNIIYKGDTTTLKNIPIDVFAHGCKKIKKLGYKDDKSYFLFIPYRKRYKCGHFKKYKIRAKDIENLKHFNLLDLEIQNELND